MTVATELELVLLIAERIQRERNCANVVRFLNAYYAAYTRDYHT